MLSLYTTLAAMLHDWDALRLPYSEDLVLLGTFDSLQEAEIIRAFGLEEMPHHIAESELDAAHYFWVRPEDEELARQIVADVTAWDKHELGGSPGMFGPEDFDVPDQAEPQSKLNRFDIIEWVFNVLCIIMVVSGGFGLVLKGLPLPLALVFLLIGAVSWKAGRIYAVKAEAAREYWQDEEEDEASMYSTRPAHAAHLSAFAAIERAAATSFPPDVLTPEQRAETVPLEVLAQAHEERRLWVGLHEEEPVGFALGEHARDGSAAVLAEMSVHPQHQRRGLGSMLVAEAIDWARAEGYAALTLTTFAEVPFDAPWYERQGFERIAEADLSDDLAQRLADEAVRGLEGRVAMRLALA